MHDWFHLVRLSLTYAKVSGVHRHAPLLSISVRQRMTLLARNPTSGVMLRVILLALAIDASRGFFATTLACCEKKCSASGLGQEVTTACRMQGCMNRWN